MSPLPAYVEYGSLATAPGPLECTGTRLWAFWVKSDRAKVRALCEKVFTRPSEGEIVVRPLPMSHVALTFGEIDKIIAGGDFSRRGNVTERQVGVWVPMTLTRRGKILPEVIGAFIPYMWLDNPLSVASGREQYGYPKAWGWATFPGEEPRGKCGGAVSDRFTLEVYGLPTHDPETKADRHRLLEVRERTGNLAVAADEVQEYEGLDDLVADAEQLLDENDRGLLELKGDEKPRLCGFSPTINQLFLKQFRAIEDSTSACLQQITKAPATPTRNGGGRRLPPHEIELTQLASHDLHEELGVPLGTSNVALSSYVEMDFEVDVGEVVWP